MIKGEQAEDSNPPAYMPESALVDWEDCNPAQLHFQKQLSDAEFFMRDHVVDGQYNVPGACYIEMALQAAKLLEKDAYAAAKENGMTVLAVFHDLNFAAEYCEKLLVLNDGRIEALGSPQDVITDDMIREVYKANIVIEKNPISNRPHIVSSAGMNHRDYETRNSQ